MHSLICAQLSVQQFCAFLNNIHIGRSHNPSYIKPSQAMCIQTIGICPYFHRENMGLNWCSLFISRGLWNLFDCSAFESLEIECPHWSCQTCLDEAAGRRKYMDASTKLHLWRSFFRRFVSRKRPTKRFSTWEMQLV